MKTVRYFTRINSVVIKRNIFYDKELLIDRIFRSTWFFDLLVVEEPVNYGFRLAIDEFTSYLNVLRSFGIYQVLFFV